jgi:hypothetical protein
MHDLRLAEKEKPSKSCDRRQYRPQITRKCLSRERVGATAEKIRKMKLENSISSSNTADGVRILSEKLFS